MFFFCMTSTIQSEIGTAKTPPPDDRLMAGVASGSREALAELYRRTDHAVYGLLLSILKNRHDAEDCMQDTYLKIEANAASYRPQGKPMAWILTIARNLAFMRLRERRRNEPDELDECLPPPKCPPTADPREEEDHMVLEGVLSLLPAQERQIVLLHATAGLKHRETAQLLGLPLSTVLSKYRRSLAKLREWLEQGGFER